MRRFRSRVWSLPAAALVALAASPATAIDKAECANAYERAQEERGAGKLRQARESLVVCAQAACPDFIQRDCTKWMSDVETALPTIVVTAKDAVGNDLTNVRVLMDGDVIAEELTGRAIAVNPGKHELRFEVEGLAPVTRQLLVNEGQKNRMVQVSFEAASVVDEAPAGEGGEPDLAGSTSTGGISNQTLGTIFGGVGVLGLAGFTIFALSGNSEKSDLEAPVSAGGCAPNCTSEQVDSVRQKYLLADISLGVGLVSLGLATYFFLTAGDKPSPQADTAVQVDVAPAPGGGFASIGGRF
jgi:hypothetical protein